MTKRPTKRPRVALVTLGCAKNVVDSERIASILEAAGVEVTADPAGASVAVVNTCGFIESAKQESIDAILEAADWKAAHGLETLIVTGCLAQRYGDELRASLPEADLLLGVDPPAAASTVLRALGIEAPAPCPASRQRAHRLTPPAWCYLKIAEGCDNRCAYCAVPLIRGPLVSRPLEEVVEEARGLLAEGVVEINVIAQDTTAYGMDRAGGRQLHTLLRSICALDGEKWVRLLYCHPARFYPELIDVLAGERQVCPYLDIPLQHIADRVLERMERKITRSRMEGLIETLRERIPGVTLRTTFMVGFPGETDREFEELLEFVRAVRFERLGAFTYSQEEGTAAAKFDGQVPEAAKQERYHALMSAQREIACGLAAARVGERTRVLVEAAAESGGKPVFGRSPREAPDVDPVILLPDEPGLRAGEVVEVEIIAGREYDCIARLTKGPGDGKG
ncbi:MAG: 30S ribosomal protein S12 methylthiotransferase RimO [Candidatus Brocadiia bacterium]|nr:30S ribosomal protein S12 methylthiotransferase RimO [Candidatus Brocadiia bacterium]